MEARRVSQILIMRQSRMKRQQNNEDKLESFQMRVGRKLVGSSINVAEYRM